MACNIEYEGIYVITTREHLEIIIIFKNREGNKKWSAARPRLAGDGRLYRIE